MIVNYDSKPETVQYMKLPNGQADVWLRRNIQQEESDEGVFWSADEKYIRTGLTERTTCLPESEIHTNRRTASGLLLST